MVLLGKDKLNTIDVLISKALIDSYITDDEFVLVNNVLREDNEMKNEILLMMQPIMIVKIWQKELFQVRC